MRGVLVTIGFVVCLIVAAVASASSAHYPFRGDYRHCGPVRGPHHSKIYISAGGVNCHKAKRIDREYYFGPADRKRLHGPDDYNGWVTLKRYPGWRCTEGTGGGGCSKHGQHALFSTL